MDARRRHGGGKRLAHRGYGFAVPFDNNSMTRSAEPMPPQQMGEKFCG
jgi:hypothetical protein